MRETKCLTNKKDCRCYETCGRHPHSIITRERIMFQRSKGMEDERFLWAHFEGNRSLNSCHGFTEDWNDMMQADTHE